LETKGSVRKLKRTIKGGALSRKKKSPRPKETRTLFFLEQGLEEDEKTSENQAKATVKRKTGSR